MFLAFDRRILHLSLTTLSGSNSQYQLKKHNYHGIAPPYPTMWIGQTSFNFDLGLKSIVSLKSKCIPSFKIIVKLWDIVISMQLIKAFKKQFKVGPK